MAKHPLSKRVAREIQLEAEQIAKGIQRPGQTKEQTRLIAHGIQRGIETYRRQQAEKERNLDRELKRLKKQGSTPESPAPVVEERVLYRQHWLPWLLFVASLGLNGYLIAAGWIR